MNAARVAAPETFSLAEGPVWDQAGRRLLWVDLLGGAVLEGALADGSITVTRRHSFDEMVGAVVVTESGSLVAAGQEGLHVLQDDATWRVGLRLLPARCGRRLNDASVDPSGRLVVGTLSLEDGSNSEELFRVESNGAVTTLDNDLGLSNGLAWSEDGRRFYSVDTFRRAVYVRDYDAATGLVGDRRVHVVVEGGYPDGIALDAEENLWVAVWGAGELRRYDRDGGLTGTVSVPAPHVSNVAFAGDDLQTVVITTATSELSADQLREFPLSGRLFTVRSEVPGLRASLLSGPSF